MEVGFVGFGRMGRAMAKNIANAGHQVRLWNRSPLGDAQIEGLTMVARPHDAFQADAVVTMLSDDAAIRDVLISSDVLLSARPGVVHIVTSTISVDFADELRTLHDAAGVGYVSAPVFGRPEVAEKAQLSIMVAGLPGMVEKVRPLLELIGRKIWVLGQDPKQANAAKIAGNMMIAMAIETMAEAAVLVHDNGLEPARFFELMLQTQFGGSRAYENYSAKILQRDFEPGFRMELGLKDLRLAVAAGRRTRNQLPLLEVLCARMEEAVIAGMGEQDWSAIADYTFRRSRAQQAQLMN
ncbi:MAG: NAD(P)-dependent oxidoreductase [Steroidobacteraceae bacterium]